MNTAAQNPNSAIARNNRENADYWHTRYVAQMDANKRLHDRIAELEEGSIQQEADFKIEVLTDKIAALEQQLTNKDRVLKARDTKIETLREELRETRLQLNNCEANGRMQPQGVDNSTLSLSGGKDSILDDVVNPEKHTSRNLSLSDLHKRRLPSGTPEPGSPAAADGCTTYRMPKK